MSRGIRIVEEEAPMEEKSIPTTREVIKGEEGERHEESIIRPTVSTKQKRIQSQVYSIRTNSCSVMGEEMLRKI